MKTFVLPAKGIRHGDDFSMVFACDDSLFESLEAVEARLVRLRELSSQQEIAPNEAAWRVPFECMVYRTRMLPDLKALAPRGAMCLHEAFVAEIAFPQMFESTRHEIEPGDLAISVDLRGEFRLCLDRKITTETFSIAYLKRLAERI